MAGETIDYAAIAKLFPSKPKAAQLGSIVSLDDLKTALRTEITRTVSLDSTRSTLCELSLPSDTFVPLIRPAVGPYSEGGARDLPDTLKTNWADINVQDAPGTPDRWQEMRGTLHPQASVSTITSIQEVDIRKRVQRAAARALVQAVEQVDGYRYIINNEWDGRDQGGLRFSYICQDSFQNTVRSATGFLADGTPLAPGKRAPRKPIYDCKGCVTVRFNGSNECVEVHYKHCAIHKPYAELELSGRRSDRVTSVPTPSTATETSIGDPPEYNTHTSRVAQPSSEQRTASAATSISPNAQKGPPRKRKRKPAEHRARPVTPQLPGEHVFSVNDAGAVEQQHQPMTQAPPIETPPSPLPHPVVLYDVPAFMRSPSPPAQLLVPQTQKLPGIPTPLNGNHPSSSFHHLPPGNYMHWYQDSNVPQQRSQEIYATNWANHQLEGTSNVAKRQPARPVAGAQGRAPGLFLTMKSIAPVKSKSRPKHPPHVPKISSGKTPTVNTTLASARLDQENLEPLDLRKRIDGSAEVSGDARGGGPRPGPPRPHPPRPPVQPPPESRLQANRIGPGVRELGAQRVTSVNRGSGGP